MKLQMPTNLYDPNDENKMFPLGATEFSECANSGAYQLVVNLGTKNMKKAEKVVRELIAQFNSSQYIFKIPDLVDALEKIKAREKPSPDNDPLGMGILSESYRIAAIALKKYYGDE